MDEAITSYLNLKPLEDLSYNDFLLKNRSVIVNELSGKPLQDQKSLVKKYFTTLAKQMIDDERFVQKIKSEKSSKKFWLDIEKDQHLAIIKMKQTAVKRKVDMCLIDIFEKSISCQGQEIMDIYDSRKKPKIEDVLEEGHTGDTTIQFGLGHGKENASSEEEQRKRSETNLQKRQSEDADTMDSTSETNAASETDIQLAWEFDEPVPVWLEKIHKHRLLAMAMDPKKQLQAASTAAWWRIVDISDRAILVPDIITQAEFVEIKDRVTSSLQKVPNSDWTVLEAPVERCLASLSKLNNRGLRKVAEKVKLRGVNGAIKMLQKLLSLKDNERNPFVDTPSASLFDDENAITNDMLIEEEDCDHEDVCYVIELLRHTFDMIQKKIPQRENSERDIDVFIGSHIFSCLDNIMDRHFRQMDALDALSNTEGYHLDWLFTRHDLGKDLTWGQEFSLCERAGSKVENSKKILDNTLRVQKTLRDMHRALVHTIMQAGGTALSKPVVRAFDKLMIPGFISSRYFIRVLLNLYVGAGYHISVRLAEFDIPIQLDELGGIVKMARTMLQVKKILRSTMEWFTQMKHKAEKDQFSKVCNFPPAVQTEFSTPKKPRTRKTK